jgi:tetratricopeptide (TPR) repeat protein
MGGPVWTDFEFETAFPPAFGRFDPAPARSKTKSAKSRADRSIAPANAYTKNALARYNRGLTLADSGRFDEALVAFDKAILLDPQIAEVHSNRGLVLATLKRFDEALAAFDKVILLDPQSARAHSNRGLVLAALKRFDEALVTLDHAISLSHTPVDEAYAFYGRGWTFASLERFDEAIVALDHATTRGAIGNCSSRQTMTPIPTITAERSAGDCAAAFVSAGAVPPS